MGYAALSRLLNSYLSNLMFELQFREHVCLWEVKVFLKFLFFKKNQFIFVFLDSFDVRMLKNKFKINK
jgi:hypothetical protein